MQYICYKIYYIEILKVFLLKKIIIGITGASGIIYSQRLLEILFSNPTIETHLIVSKSSEQIRHTEIDKTSLELKKLANYHYNVNNISALIASGSFRTNGMIIIPCSMNTLGEIANGISRNLITRAADVVLKEKRKLILVTRETPLHIKHLENMVQATKIGAIISPPIPAFYNKPESIKDLIDYTIVRILDLFNIKVNFLVKRWGSIY